VTSHITSSEEIASLLAVADRDLVDAQTQGLSMDWRFNIAHNALLQSANAALAASGYRAERSAQHYRVIQSLEYTIGLDPVIVDRINKLHKKRNVASYTSAGVISKKEAEEMLNLARDIRQKVEKWLRDVRPELM
jgi:uncharacterized protein (UPF0332 family)